MTAFAGITHKDLIRQLLRHQDEMREVGAMLMTRSSDLRDVVDKFIVSVERSKAVFMAFDALEVIASDREERMNHSREKTRKDAVWGEVKEIPNGG